MALAIPNTAGLKRYAWSGIKDGAVGGVFTGVGGMMAGQLGIIIGGAIGATMMKNSVIALNATQDAVASMFLGAGA